MFLQTHCYRIINIVISNQRLVQNSNTIKGVLKFKSNVWEIINRTTDIDGRIQTFLKFTLASLRKVHMWLTYGTAVTLADVFYKLVNMAMNIELLAVQSEVFNKRAYPVPIICFTLSVPITGFTLCVWHNIQKQISVNKTLCIVWENLN